ncbi:protein phosphatase 2C-like protein [Saccharothrix saharensis]|uniref:Protein phosphatase 2C-like protein n=1 Tax=Saccharothrix saharensis TaxID=571190 RepID=A0A543J6E7_9PSEU|nr:protein phosphatase 2C domain-containing protein [Saccharothrix saharensis]TQM78391.1 protein phosphatase 2C-like protein [Saccharothrix saharensis]
MSHTRQVVFYAPKHGNAEAEWEDGAAAAPADGAGRGPRFAVADGATQGFGSARWAQQLVAGFVGDQGAAPDLTAAALRRWASDMQARWHDDPRLAGATDLQRLKQATVGSFATFLGCELHDLAGRRPRWTAVALGDAVLFHVRGHRVVAQFPPIAPDGFGSNPDGLPTGSAALDDMVDRAVFANGDLADGDLLYLATDAFAQWVAAADLRDGPALWTALARLDHPEAFRELVRGRRAAREMVNDDVTLVRVRFTRAPATHLVVCL